MGRYNRNIIPITFVLFIVFYYVYNRLNIPTDIYQTHDWLAFRDINGGVYGYNSVMNLYIIYVLPYLFCLNRILKVENIVWSMRMENRTRILAYRRRVVLEYTFYFVILHCLINVLACTIFFHIDLLIEVQFYQAQLFYVLGNMFFYLIVAQTFLIFGDSISREKSILVTSIIFALIYYCNRVYMGYSMINNQMVQDVLIDSSNPYKVIISGIIQKIGICVVLYSIGKFIYTRKDIYE